MASEMIGRTTCPECTFPGAHVKQKQEEGKEKLPYRYCPDCSAQYYTRSKHQAAALMEKTRKPDQAAPPPAAVPAAAGAPELPVAAAAADDGRSTPAPVKKGFWGALAEGIDV